jgi:TolB-like protein/Flp pilus assembly protein TadD
LQPGDQVHHYRIVAPLGAGGMGEVYLAEDTRLGRQVAIKVLPAPFAGDADRVRRFEQEARAVSALNHPHILTLFDLGRAGDQYFMATEFVDGRTLRAHLAERGRLGVAEALEIARQCASALASAHVADIVHRDVKPENVMLRRDGYVKVLDFGLAKVLERSSPDDETAEIRPNLTSAGVVLGTVGYLSPEQARGQHVDARTDVFSLGVMLYEMVAGARPFDGPTPTDVLAAILRAEPAPIDAIVPGAPAGLSPILGRALDKNREARYQSMGELAADLDRLAREIAFDTHAQTRSPRAVPTTGSRWNLPRWWAAIAVSAVLIAAGALWWRSFDTGPAGGPSAPATVAAVRTLAVLPFQLLASPDAREHVGLGMADALIVKLTQLRQLTVRPTSAVAKYQRVDQDAAAIGRALQVDAVLMGRVQESGGRVRVTVQLVGARSPEAQAIWSDEFTAATNDPFDVQDQVAARLVQKLALEISAEEQAKLTKPATANPRARERYMEGRFFINKRTVADYQRALELFGDAAREDPRYAMAYLGQALAWIALLETGGAPVPESLPRLRSSLAQAIDLDPALGEAYGLRSQIARVYDWDFALAARDSQQSMTLDPTHPMVLQWRGVHLLALGERDEAVRMHTRAVEIDPVDLVVRSQLCRALYFTRRYDEAVRAADALIQFDKSQSAAYQWWGLSQLELGHLDLAMGALLEAAKLAPDNGERVASLAYGYARNGQAAEARRLIAKLAAPGGGVATSYHIATIHAGLGDHKAALDWLERARQERNGFLVNRVKLDPKLDAVRNKPIFSALLKSMGLE